MRRITLREHGVDRSERQREEGWHNSNGMALLTSTDSAAVGEGTRPGGENARIRTVFSGAVGEVLQFCIEWLVRLTGRRVAKKDAPWLDCVLGKPGFIGNRVYKTAGLPPPPRKILFGS